MTIFLVENVIADCIYLTSRIRKCSESLLPIKSAANPSVPVDEVRGTCFYIAHEIRNRYRRFDPNEQMNVIGHAEYGDQFLAAFVDDSGYIFVQFLTPFRRDEILSSFDGENDLYVYLRKGIWHGGSKVAPTELGSN